MPHFELQNPETAPPIPLIAHVPHGATTIPPSVRGQLVLDDEALQRELLAMTDHETNALVAGAVLQEGGSLFINRVSRLVCDPERFEDDAAEAMSKKGMGAVYMRTADGAPLRHEGFSAAEREAILRDFFRPYAQALERAVAGQLETFGRCLILDVHSFPAVPLPYEDPALDRPGLCLGYDPFHGPPPLVTALTQAAEQAGWSVGHNTPFAGSYVPSRYYREDARVSSVMLEINRRLYLDESTGRRGPGFQQTQAVVGRLVERAVLFEAFRHTSFDVEHPAGAFSIRVGERCPPLDALLQEAPLETWAYLTAYNPGGSEASDATNQEAQTRLEAELQRRRLSFHRGAGRADMGDWPPEPSLLILGIDRPDALELASQFGQAALVVGRTGELAELALP